jgi:hypothetical protein
MVKRQLQIVISKRPSVEGTPPTGRLGGLDRIKLVFAGVLFAAATVVVLVLIFVVGSILGAIIWIALVVGIVGLILKSTLRRVSK